MVRLPVLSSFVLICQICPVTLYGDVEVRIWIWIWLEWLFETTLILEASNVSSGGASSNFHSSKLSLTIPSLWLG